jgi:DNA-binding transcriptional MerR regulator
MTDAAYSLADLCELADVTPRTVRYYISQGLLRSPGTTGPGARYDDGHLARLRLIRMLQREHLPLAEIRSRLAALSDAEAIARAEGPTAPPAGTALDYVRDVLGDRVLRGAARPAPSPAPTPPPVLSPPSAAGPPRAALRLTQVLQASPARDARPAPPEPLPGQRATWDRYVLAPDVELHVRRPLTRSQNRAVARLLEAARQILEEDQP